MSETKSQSRRTTPDAAEVLHRRYVAGDAAREVSLEHERTNAHVARLIRQLRTNAALTQSDLAVLIGTTQSVISRLEDADYDGHSLSMLTRIAEALNQRLTVAMTARDPQASPIESIFPQVAQMLRRDRGLTVDELATKTNLNSVELRAIERQAGYRPSPRTIHRLSEFYEIPQRALAALAGAFRDLPLVLREHAAEFAARSESVAALTAEEKAELEDFIGALRKSGNEATDDTDG